MLTLALSLSLCLAAAPAAPPARVVPLAPKPPKLDGVTKDLARAVPLALTQAGAKSSGLEAKALATKGALYLGVTADDADVSTGDSLSVTLFFKEAGLTAQGHSFRFAGDGPRAPNAETAAPAFAQALVRSAAKSSGGKATYELSIPVGALPRFPAKLPLLAEVCLTYENRSEPGAEAVEQKGCDAAVLLPEELRRALKLKPHALVEGLERRENAWVGFELLRFPLWIQGDEPLTARTLGPLVSDELLSEETVRVSMPETMRLPDGQTLRAVFAGKDPQTVEGSCDSEKEIRLGLYAVKGKVALRALEWPVASCGLGRAVSVVLDEEGSLTIGYTSGATTTFAWTGERFERTEIGMR